MIDRPDMNPWEGITSADKPDTLNTRRCHTSNPHEFFWSRNHLGNYGFLFRSRVSPKSGRTAPALEGIEIELNPDESGGSVLHLMLVELPSRDIFRTICHDLLQATSQIDPVHGEAVIGAVLTRLERWQHLLRMPRNKLLSETSRIGLFGELLVLRDHFLNSLDVVTAISAWQGPMGAEQDFAFEELLVEVKTQLSSADRKIRISSLEQLDDRSGEILLLHQTISPDEKGMPGAMTLQKIVDNIRESLATSIFASDLFERALLEVGFRDAEEYDEVGYLLSTRNIYIMGDGFPRLTRTSVPGPVVSATYILDVASLDPWGIDESGLTDRIDGKDDNT